MGDVRLTAAAYLAVMGLFSEEVGALHEQYLRIVKIGIDLTFKACEGTVGVAANLWLGTGGGF